MWKPTKMIAYGYTEDQGGKGNKNVASLIMKGLTDLGRLKQDYPRKPLLQLWTIAAGKIRTSAFFINYFPKMLAIIFQPI
jgi:hypothetical protein